MKFVKVKVRFYCDDFEEEKILELCELWTYNDIEEAFEGWVNENTDSGYEILELDGKPWKGE